MAVECKTCVELKRLNDELIKKQYFLIRDFRTFVKNSIKSDEDILERLVSSSAALDNLLRNMSI